VGPRLSCTSNSFVIEILRQFDSEASRKSIFLIDLHYLPAEKLPIPMHGCFLICQLRLEMPDVSFARHFRFP
jgi:hypothetical protein